MTPDVAQQPQVDPLRALRAMAGTGGDGDTPGFSVGGDPSKAASVSQETKDRVRDAVVGGLGKNLGMSALNTAKNLAIGMPTGFIGQSVLGSLASPGAVGGVLGSGLNAALGTQPEGFLGKAVSRFAVPTAAGLAFGPVGGLLAGTFGGLISDAVMDGIDARSREEVRDDYEDQAGYFGGRNAYADRVGAEKKAAKVRDALPNSMAALHAMDQAIAATRALEQRRGITPTYGMEPGGRSAGGTYGGWGSVGGPSIGGARAVDPGYGHNMGGWAGLGIGNPSSYGGGRDNDRDNGGFGANDGNSDTAGNAGYGR
jgi:hypothetical protein